jgi:glycerate kinase
VLELVGFAETLAGAAPVVVGEGSLDERLRGKAVVGVAGVVRAAGVPVVAVCGRSTLDDAQVRGAGLDAAYALLDLEPDPEVCMRDAAGLLPRLAARIVTDGRLGPPS